VAAIKLPVIAIKGATEDRIYENGWGTDTLTGPCTMAYWANGQKRRTPGEYANDRGDFMDKTDEYIHPVVNFRVNWLKVQNSNDPSRPIYKPGNPELKDERRKVGDKDGKPFFENNVCG
jgi:hypothetical protein